MSLAVMAADTSTANQISARLSDSTSFISYLASQNFPNVAVTSKPAAFDSSNMLAISPSPASRACPMTRPTLLFTALLAGAAVAVVLL